MSNNNFKNLKENINFPIYDLIFNPESVNINMFKKTLNEKEKNQIQNELENIKKDINKHALVEAIFPIIDGINIAFENNKFQIKYPNNNSSMLPPENIYCIFVHLWYEIFSFFEDIPEDISIKNPIYLNRKNKNINLNIIKKTLKLFDENDIICTWWKEEDPFEKEMTDLILNDNFELTQEEKDELLLNDEKIINLDACSVIHFLQEGNTSHISDWYQRTTLHKFQKTIHEANIRYGQDETGYEFYEPFENLVTKFKTYNINLIDANMFDKILSENNIPYIYDDFCTK